jgi:hypothetical protein
MEQDKSSDNCSRDLCRQVDYLLRSDADSLGRCFGLYLHESIEFMLSRTGRGRYVRFMKIQAPMTEKLTH